MHPNKTRTTLALMNSHDPLYVKKESSTHSGYVRGLHTSVASAQEGDN